MLVKPLVRPIVRAIAGNPTASLGSGFSPTSLFADGSKGVVYDNNDLSSFYLDSAGTTAATVNGLVGLQLDKSANLALGAEIKSSGAIGLIGAATVATYNTSTGEGTATRVDASNQSFVNWTGLATGSWYLLTIQNTGANAVLIRSGSQAGTTWLTLLTTETKTIYVPETAGLVTITSSGGAVSFTVSTIKAVSGNHRYQTTTGSKPVLRGTPTGANIVTNGDFASGTGWTVNSGWAIGSGVATATTSSGTLTSALTATASKVYRLTYTITASAGSIQPSFGGVTGASRTAAGTYVEYLTASSTAALVFTGTTFSGTVDNIEIVDVSAGSVTAPYGLQYDGVDDFMVTAAVDFTATDKMFVCSGLQKLTDAGAGSAHSLGNIAVTNGSFEVFAPNAGANYQAQIRGNTSSSVYTFTTYTAPVKNVVALTMDYAAATGSEVIARINAATPTTATGIESGTGPFANQTLYFGRRTGTSLPYNGLDFGMVICGKTLTSTQISQTERYIAQRTGVTI